MTRPPVVTDEVVERVARAIWTALDHSVGPMECNLVGAAFNDGKNVMLDGHFDLTIVARAALASMPAVVSGGQGWQPIESAHDDTNMLLALPCGEVIVGYKAPRGWVDLVDQRVMPTHWMPMPEPPAKGAIQ